MALFRHFAFQLDFLMEVMAFSVQEDTNAIMCFFHLLSIYKLAERPGVARGKKIIFLVYNP